jgi:pyroglutamyl-peptidase
VNPSELVVRSLEGRIIGGCTLDVRVLPVDTVAAGAYVRRAFAETRPIVAIGVGLAAGRTALGLERVAVNVRDFEVADASGATPKNEPVDPAGPDGRLSTLPLQAVVDAWDAAGVPGYVSDSAGTYLCNQWLYEALGVAAEQSPPVATGFIHLPALPQQAMALGADRTPSMSLELMRRGIEVAIEAIARELESRPAAPAVRATPSDWIPRGLTKR